MPGKDSNELPNTREFIRVSRRSVKRLQDVRGLSDFSRNRLKDLEMKILDLRAKSLRSGDLQELMFEISTEISTAENSSRAVPSRDLSYLSSYASSYRNRFPDLFRTYSPSELILNDYRRTFDLVQKMDDHDGIQKWRAYNRERNDEALLYIYPLSRKSDGSYHQFMDFAVWKVLDHRNILKLWEVYPHIGSFGVETDFASDGNLSSLRKPMPMEETMPVMLQVSDAMEYAHSRNAYHLGLSPEDIMVSGTGILKLSGWSKWPRYQEEGNPEQPEPYFRSFSAPELPSEADYQKQGPADIYSMALITCYLLTGKVLKPEAGNNGEPADEASWAENISSALEGSGIGDPVLVSILRRNLSLDPAARMTAEEFHASLARLENPGGVDEGEPHGTHGRDYTNIQVSSMGSKLSDTTSENRDNVTRIEINLKGSMGDDEERRKASQLRSLSKSLQKNLEQEKYETISNSLKKNGKLIVEAFPGLKEEIDHTLSNISAVIRFPTVPREEVNARIRGIIKELSPDE